MCRQRLQEEVCCLRARVASRGIVVVRLFIMASLIIGVLSNVNGCGCGSEQVQWVESIKKSPVRDVKRHATQSRNATPTDDSTQHSPKYHLRHGKITFTMPAEFISKRPLQPTKSQPLSNHYTESGTQRVNNLAFEIDRTAKSKAASKSE